MTSPALPLGAAKARLVYVLYRFSSRDGPHDIGFTVHRASGTQEPEGSAVPRFDRAMIDRRNLQAFHPFARLSRLLEGVPPAPSPGPGGTPIALSVGEPQRSPPAFVAEELAAAAGQWGRYPPPRGTPAHLNAVADWLRRRYGLPGEAIGAGAMLDPERCLLPLPGSREGLFFAALATVPASANGTPPAVLMPNPCYHVYAGATAAAGAEPVFVPASADTGFLPDYGAVAPEVLERTALCYVCSPANPQGAAADPAYLQDLIRLARRYDFVVAFDECYSEIYTDEAPAGAVQAALALDGSLDNLLLFHSLSKRSNAAGLRCGFVAGAPKLIDALDAALRVGGAGVPLPALAAGTRLWQDDAHVRETRAFYRANFAVAERLLGNRFAFRKPQGGFFLWLDVGDGEAAARALWRDGGIRVLPGAYMCAEDANGGGNPGERYIRAALVYDAELTEAALARMAEIL